MTDNMNDIADKMADELASDLQKPIMLIDERETQDNLHDLDLNSRDKVIANLSNLAKILRQDSKIKGMFAYNEFTYDIELTRAGKIGKQKTETRQQVDDSLITGVRFYISEKYGADFKKGDVADGVELVARELNFNPLETWLLNAERDYQGTDPLTILSDYLGVAGGAYTRLVTSIFFRGAVAKVLNPRQKFDNVLDLVGDQGTGKSTMIRMLFEPYYTDNISTFYKSDDMALMVKNWGINDDEMVASNDKNTSFGQLKKAITQQEFQYRPPYARKAVNVNKNFVIIRTTNVSEHLRDATGDRRFLPIRVSKDITPPKRFKELTEQALKEFWGGIVSLWRVNPSFDLNDEEQTLLDSEKEQFKSKNIFVEQLESYVETPITADFYNLGAGRRRDYIAQMMDTGTALYDSRDITGNVARDRVNVTDVMAELFPNEQKKTVDNVIRLFFNNLDGWEPKKSLKFGKKVARGWQKR
ncbi:VapE domain-containing protein [Lactococcus insecticola]|uniref:Virulence protein n=1 Tax=Pseudolactococcus insecticola TaxID=2709158 RepID=A0A6A0B7X5_9LACT|nr:VapE domain-containing protein [Lactococcus insecticola]GFH41440.1 virulence protein [Lactococcus insecticola]